jgi:hypothetical protein
MMNQRIIAFILPLILIAGCVTRESNPTVAQLEASAQIMQSFVAQVSALADEYPELAEFKNRNPDTQTELEVRFSHGVGAIKEMRGVRTQDLEPKGIYLNFLIRRKDDPVWTDGPMIRLNALGMDLYSGYVLSEEATPGLNEILKTIFSEHWQLFLELNEKSANNDIVRKKPP